MYYLLYERYIEEIINLYSNVDIVYSINNSKQMGSLTSEEGYTLFELLPFGYAIVANSNGALMEVCYDDCALPFHILDSRDYYYVGPSSFAKKHQNALINIETNIELTQQDINYVATVEANIISSTAQTRSFNLCSDILVSDRVVRRVVRNVEFDYFSNLSSFGNNVDGTCTVIAISMLLGYYDVFVDDDCIEDAYMNSSSIPVGTTDEFHQLLCDYVYGENEPGGIQIYDAASAINDYLSDRNLQVEFVSPPRHNVALTRTSVINLIGQGKPVVASMDPSDGASMHHSVVVYGYIYTPTDGSEPILPSATITSVPENAMYRAHRGHHGSSNYYRASLKTPRTTNRRNLFRHSLQKSFA